MTFAPVLVGAAAFFVSAVLTLVVERFAGRWGLIDVENDRSLHAGARPRGGGVAIAAAVPISLAIGAAADALIWRECWIVIALATLLGGVGLIDDRRRLHYSTKLAAQLVVAGALVAAVGPVRTIVIPGMRSMIALDLPSSLAALVTTMAIVGFTNAFNFIDGIDGLAASQGVVNAGIIAFAAAMIGVQGVVPVAIAGASAGFLAHNFPPARVFMGDVGSQYLGFLMAGLAVVYDRKVGVPASLIALAFLPIALDTASTLALRVLRGRAWSEAHRDHVYQRLVRSGWSHGRTTVLYLVMTAACGTGVLFCIDAPARGGWIYWVFALPTVAIVLRLQKS